MPQQHTSPRNKPTHHRPQTRLSHGRQIAGTHRFADTVRHKPRSFQSDAQYAVKLIAGNALLAASDQIHRLQPDTHRNLAVLEDGANLHGERLAALVALPQASVGSLALQLTYALHPVPIMTNASARAAKEIAGKEPFEVLVIGGGPVGASAAIYPSNPLLRNIS